MTRTSGNGSGATAVHIALQGKGGVPAREKPTIEDVNPTYFWAACGFALGKKDPAQSEAVK